MGRAARLNPATAMVKAGQLKPRVKTTAAQERDRLRATLPDYTRLSMLKHVGVDSGIPVALKAIVANVKPKRKVTITRIEE